MKLIELVVSTAVHAPAVALEGAAGREYEKLGYGIRWQQYAGASLLIALLLSLALVLFAFAALRWQAQLVFPTALLAFALSFYFLLSLPALEVRTRTLEMEAELPLALRTMGMLLDMKIPFGQALEVLAGEKGTAGRSGIIGKEFEKIAAEAKSGVSIQKVLSGVALSYNSIELKRAFSQMITAYDVGSSGRELYRIGEELLSIQQHRLRDYSSKGALFGLLFIVASAVLPTFFLLYAILGEYMAGDSIGKTWLALGMLLLFPLVGMLLLLLAKGSAPATVFGQADGVYGPVMLMPVLVLAGAFLLPQQLMVAGLVLFFALALYLAYSWHEQEGKVEEIEYYLADALFSVAGLPKSAGMEIVFGTIAGAGYGTLSAECKKTCRQLSAGISPAAALEDLCGRNDSVMLRKACMMLKHAYNTNSLDRMNLLAEDIMQFSEIKRERANATAMQKYTILFGGLLIPLILKITLNLLTSLAGFFNGNRELLAFSFSLVPAYLGVYSFLSAVYIAETEGKRSGMPVYFIVLALISLLSFHLITLS